LDAALYGNVYTYDAKGNITAVKDLSNQKSAATYDSFDNLLSYVQPGSAATEKYLFTYGTTDAEKKRHLPLTATTPTGVKTTTEYNPYGSAINATVQENASAPLIRTETEYTEDGNFVTKQRDARGNEVINTLDANGKLLSVTDPAGQAVNYSYDASNRVTSVQSSYTVNGEERVSRNEYTYENDRLKTVAHNTTGNAADVVYNFEYDELGRKTTVKVGEQALSTNVYSPDRKSRLEEVQYGNGGKVKYTYDDFDRVTGVGYDNDESPRFSYEYDSKGRAAFVKDSTDGSTIHTGYDQTDRPNETEQRDGDGNLKYRTLIEYDKKNRVKAFNEATDDANFKTEYTYDADNRVTKVRYNSSDTSKVDYIYDKLNRITSRTVTNGTSAYATQYAYAPGAVVYGENATTPLVSSITQGEGENAMNFAYIYDNRGNITSETRNGLTTTYVYDALGQLIRVNDPHENATWVYAYDRGGNILNKVKYAYTTTDELGEALESIPYTYGDANWKDKLTAYNGVPITYDAIGNPLNDGTWTYEWQAGRQLKRMTNAATGVTMEFTYNHDGLRTKKVKKVNGVPAETTEYILNGKRVIGLTHTIHMENVTDMMHFFYDPHGKVVQVNYNRITYSYVRNFQGDIVGILDNSGTIMVEYNYDAWGKPLSMNGSLANTLGRRNPFMYRGYVWDEEMGMYYLRSRYYSLIFYRFLNADVLIARNIYAYCSNAPVLHYDVSGQACQKCLDAVGRTADRYVLDRAQSRWFSQWLSQKYPREELKSLAAEIVDSLVPGLVSDGAEKAAESFSKFTPATLALFKALSIGGDICEPIKLHSSKTGKDIKEFYQETRSNYEPTRGTIIDVYEGWSEVVLSITVLLDGESITETWVDVGAFDKVSARTIGSVWSFLKETYTPVSHGHPAYGVDYEDYVWE